jgi:fumarylacetoacetase
MRPEGAEAATRVAAVNTADALYWNAAQQLAHLTANGASIRPGDLFGSGTVSGPERSQSGSLLELTWSGRDPIDVGGMARTFLEDGDEVVLRGAARAGGELVPLGPVGGTIVAG